MGKTFNFTFLFLFFCSLLSRAQHPFYYKIDTSKGLPSNTIYDIYQDHIGFMWFATDRGICRFDGKHFETYTLDTQTSKSGSNLKEDKFGRIWYSNFDGYLYYVENGALHALNNPETIGFAKFGIVNDYLFVIQRNFLLVYQLKNLKVVKKIPLQTDVLIATHNSKNRFYLICNQLIEIDSQLQIKTSPLPEKIAKKFPASIIQDSPEGMLIVSKYAPYYYSYANGHFEQKQIVGKFNFIQNLSYDQTTNWICTTQGVIRYQNKTIDTKNTYFKSFNISYVFKDREGNYWFSTISDGLLLVPDISTHFIPFEPKPNVISVSDNNLFVGTTTDFVYKIKLPNFQKETFYNGTTNHEVYFLTTDKTLKKCFFTSNAFQSYYYNGKKDVNAILAVKDIQKIDAAYYAFAASGVCGFIKVNDVKSKWDEFLNQNQVGSNIDKKIRPILTGVQGKSATYNPFNQTVYFASSSGLIAFTRHAKKELLWKGHTLYLSKIKNVNCEVYGFSTNEKLFRIDRNNAISIYDTSKYTNNEPLQKVKIIGNSLFLFTPYSIYEHNLNTKKTKKIIALNPEFEISDLDIYQDQLILANSRGFLLINRNHPQNTIAPKFHINRIYVNDKKINPTRINSLAYDQNNISINFSLLTFIPNQKNRLFYKINDEKWQSFDDDSRNLKLRALAPGNYTIQFQLVYNNKYTPVTAIQFEIKKPFWLTAWFFGIMALSIIFLCYWGFQWQLRKIQKRNQLIIDRIQLEKNVNQSKLKAIKSQMNPHFFYNALNTIQSFILANEKKQAVNYLSKFSSLTRMILEMSDKEVISIAEEIKALSLYLEIEKARFEEDFSYQIQTDSSLDTENLKIPTLLIQPYVENAIKHGLLHKSGPKILHLDFALVDHQIVITIDDNGVGRQKSSELNQIKNRKHKSFATEALQNRISLWNLYHNQPIQLEISDKISANGIALGTIVQLKIPYSS